MKIAFLFLIAFNLNSITSAGTYFIRVENNSFIPSSLNLNSGDQVIWKLIEGTHSTTSLAVPPGAASWDHNFSGPGDLFLYNVTVPGMYTYNCSFSSGMTGDFEAADNFPLRENFNYPEGDSIRLYGWNTTGNVFTNPVTVVSPGLIYPGYQLSGIGNAAELKSSGADLNKEFPDSVFSGSLYASLMVNVSEARSGDYFFHFSISLGNTNTFPGRIFVKQAMNGNISFGISKSTTSSTIVPVYSDSIYVNGETYLLVIKYTFNPGLNDDSVFLFINPDLSIKEPQPLLAHGSSSGNDPLILRTLNLRQGNASSAPDIIVDGIKAALNWIDILPVELNFFDLSVSGNNVELNWSTAAELNNAGFEVQKNISSQWITAGFVKGRGTTTELSLYFFTDKELFPGTYIYRLKQVNTNGSFTFSGLLKAEIKFPFAFQLLQNYPNPFNPSTRIYFSLAEDAYTVLSVYNIAGEEIIRLVEGKKSAGVYNIAFSGENFPAGVYIYSLRANDVFLSRKMLLLK